MRNRRQIVIDALTRELARAEQKAAKAKAEADECAGIAGEMLAIDRELREIVLSREHGPAILKRLEALKLRDAKAQRILRKDFVKLLDAQLNAEADRDKVARELDSAKALHAIYGGGFEL